MAFDFGFGHHWLLVFVCQDSVNDLSEITVIDKEERRSELSQFPTASKSSSSLKYVVVDSLDMKASSAVGSVEGFAGNAALETSSAGDLTNGQVAEEHMSVGGLWQDVAAMQLSSSNMMTFPATSMPLYAPLVVRCAVFAVISPLFCHADLLV